MKTTMTPIWPRIPRHALPSGALERCSFAVDIRRADPTDVAAITACVREAYLPYVKRLGREPGPMRQDYAEVVASCEVCVAVIEDQVAGVLVLRDDKEGLWVDNVAVCARFQGTGIGRVLLVRAERRGRQLRRDALHLFTHELMTENRGMYERNGWQEVRSGVVDGYPRVFMRKALPR